MDLFFMFRNYNKPGPGVKDNEPQKEGAALFFQVLGRKFKPMVSMNLIYVLYSLPMIIMILVLSGMVTNMLLASDVTKQMINAVSTINGQIDEVSYLRWSFWLDVSVRVFLTVSVLILWGSGPASAAMYAVHDCHMRSEPIWLWSDYNDYFKKNFKQAIIVSVIDVLFFFLMVVAYVVYGKMRTFIDLRILITVILAVYSMMHQYIYPMMVKYNLKLRDLYKNSLIFAIGKLPQTLIVLVIWVFIAVFPLLVIYILPEIAVYGVIIYLIGAVFLTFSFSTLISAVNSRKIMNTAFADKSK